MNDLLTAKTISSLACTKKSTIVHQPDFVNDAYIHLLRNSCHLKRIYQINPYVEVYQLRKNLYCLYTENCDAGGAVYMHLIIGPKRALLIDTAYGLGNLPALIDLLTGGKPLLVTNTHHHCDHAYGNCRFPQVYCHKYDVPFLQAQDIHIWNYLFDDNGNGKWLDFDKNDLPSFKSYQIIPFENGHIFDLGNGYKIEAVWLGGHTPGHCGYLDKQNRIFFSGDDITSNGCSAGMGPNPDETNEYAFRYMNLKSFHDALLPIAARQNEFDFIFPQHGALELDSSLIPVLLNTCEEVINNPDDYHFSTSFPGLKGEPPVTCYNRHIPGLGVLCYRMNGIYPIKQDTPTY